MAFSCVTIKNYIISLKVGGAFYRGADKSVVRPGKKQAQKHVRVARDFSKTETRAVIKLFFFCKARRRREFTPF